MASLLLHQSPQYNPQARPVMNPPAKSVVDPVKMRCREEKPKPLPEERSTCRRRGLQENRQILRPAMPYRTAMCPQPLLTETFHMPLTQAQTRHEEVLVMPSCIRKRMSHTVITWTQTVLQDRRPQAVCLSHYQRFSPSGKSRVLPNPNSFTGTFRQPLLLPIAMDRQQQRLRLYQTRVLPRTQDP